MASVRARSRPTRKTSFSSGMKCLQLTLSQTLCIGSHNLSWARAAAWFEAWPRTVAELQYFLPPTPSRPHPSHMHGSHICHHGLCIVPRHVTYEDDDTNLSRMSCARLARELRMYGMDIPEHCCKHQPPCLLQVRTSTAVCSPHMLTS